MNEKFFKIVYFLKELSANNNKQWMDQNRTRYLELKQDWIDFVDELIRDVYDFDSSIGYLDPKESIFRINRDLRFSHNKNPYNTHFSAVIAKGGRKSQYACYYIRLNQDGEVYIGGGMWEIDSSLLNNLRKYIEKGNNSYKFKKILKDPDFFKTFGTLLEDNKTKRIPSGFEKSKNIELMKYKSFLVSNTSILSNSNNLNDEIKTKFKTLFPFIKYLNSGILFIK